MNMRDKFLRNLGANRTVVGPINALTLYIAVEAATLGTRLLTDTVTADTLAR